jgi:hypothetical protein
MRVAGDVAVLLPIVPPPPGCWASMHTQAHALPGLLPGAALPRPRTPAAWCAGCWASTAARLATLHPAPLHPLPGGPDEHMCFPSRVVRAPLRRACVYTRFRPSGRKALAWRDETKPPGVIYIGYQAQELRRALPPPQAGHRVDSV